MTAGLSHTAKDNGNPRIGKLRKIGKSGLYFALEKFITKSWLKEMVFCLNRIRKSRA